MFISRKRWNEAMCSIENLSIEVEYLKRYAAEVAEKSGVEIDDRYGIMKSQPKKMPPYAD